MINIYHNRKRVMTLPELPDELTARQFIGLAPVLFAGGDEVQCKVRALRAICNLGTYRWRMLKPEVINRCLPFLDWIFDPKAPLSVTRQLIPTYRAMHGPIDDFDNLKMSEFHYSELAYKEMISGDQEAIDKLVAVLYRKPKSGYNEKLNPDGDIRVPFNSNEVPYYQQKVKRWPAKVKQAIFLWYDACRQELIKSNPLVFKDHGSDFISQFETGLYGMMRSLAGNRLGPVSVIEDMYVHTAMLEIGLMREEEKYIEEQMKKKSK